MICTAGGAAGKSPSTCTALKYDIPKAADLVRKGTNWTDFVLTPFGELKPADVLEVCATELPAPTISPVPYTSADPCTSFVSVAASSMATTPSLPLQWTRPLQNENGTQLTDLAGYRILYGTSANALTQTVEIKDPSKLAYTLTGLDYGVTYFVAIRAFTTGNTESEKSNTLSKAMPAKPAAPTKPQAPVLSVTDLTAYDLVKANDKLTAVAIGTVPAETKCLAAVRAMDLYGVPRASVKLNASIKTRPQVVLAKCA